MGSAFGYFLGFMVPNQFVLCWLGAGIFLPCSIAAVILANEKAYITRSMKEVGSLDINSSGETEESSDLATEELWERVKSYKEILEQAKSFPMAFWLLIVQQWFAW
jgi:hypothetical protein